MNAGVRYEIYSKVNSKMYAKKKKICCIVPFLNQLSLLICLSGSISVQSLLMASCNSSPTKPRLIMNKVSVLSKVRLILNLISFSSMSWEVAYETVLLLLLLSSVFFWSLITCWLPLGMNLLDPHIGFCEVEEYFLASSDRLCLISSGGSGMTMLSWIV